MILVRGKFLWHFSIVQSPTCQPSAPKEMLACRALPGNTIVPDLASTFMDWNPWRTEKAAALHGFPGISGKYQCLVGWPFLLFREGAGCDCCYFSFQRQTSAQALEGEQDREQCVNRMSFSFSKCMSHSVVMLKKTKGANCGILHPA